MIKLVNALVGIFLVFAGGQWLSASAEAGEVLDRIMKKGAMITATDPEWPPFSSRNDKGEFDGFDIAVAKELATRMGVVPRLCDSDLGGDDSRSLEREMGHLGRQHDTDSQAR